MQQGSPISQFRRARAQALRRDETSAERRLWRALKSIPVHGTHFRRQVPIGPYIADFACLKARLILEVDGGSHVTEAGQQHDAERDRFLMAEGYRVLRFWNAEIFENERGVIETIHAALNGLLDLPADQDMSPHPGPAGRPSPSRGG